jgi:hypothetical protein
VLTQINGLPMFDQGHSGSRRTLDNAPPSVLPNHGNVTSVEFLNLANLPAPNPFFGMSCTAPPDRTIAAGNRKHLFFRVLARWLLTNINVRAHPPSSGPFVALMVA